MAVDETGIGVYEDKILKNKGKARVIWNNLKDKKSRGIIGEDAETNLVFVAKPMGVVAAVTPVTNPDCHADVQCHVCPQDGQCCDFCPSPQGGEAARRFSPQEFMKVVKANGGPDDLIQIVENGSIETTQELMKVVDVVVATGGGAMVKSAYSSGKPSFGVGAGNVPVIIDRDVESRGRGDKIVNGASFDNGIICSHEQFVLAPEEQYGEALKSFEATGKVWFTEDETLVQKFRDVVFPGGHLNKDVVGRSCRDIGAMAGIDVPENARIILLPPKAPARTMCWQRRSSARSWPSCRTRPSRKRLRRPRPTSLSKAPDTPPPCIPTTKPTSVMPARNCRSAVWWSTRRVP